MNYKLISKKIVFLLLLSLSVNLCSNEMEKISIQLKWYHQFQFAGYYVAKEKGYYKEQNLDVTLLEGGVNINVHEIISENKAEFGILGSELVLFRDQHKNFVVLAPIMQHSIRAIIGNRNKGVNSIHDLYNKNININLSELPEFQAMFNNEGIDINQLNYTQKDSSSMSKFINGDVSAINGSIANQPYLFKKENIPISIIKPIDYGIDFYGDTLFTTRSVIKKNPKMVELIVEATKKGWDYALKNPEETIDIIVNTYKSKNSREHLYYEYEQLKKLIQPDLVEIGHNNHERWERIVDTYKSLKLLEPDYNLKGFFYEPEKERELLFKSIFFSVIVVSVITLIVMLLIFNFNNKLKKLVYIKTKDLILSENKYKDLALDLQISREDLRITLNSIGDAVVVTDNNGLITKMNPVAEKLTNWNFDDAKNKSHKVVLNILSGEAGESLDDSIEQALSTGKIVNFIKSKILISKDKTKYNITETVAPIKDQKGNIKGVVLVFRDITEEYDLQGKLNHRSKMDAIGQLAGGIAHDLNNSLTPIIGATEMILHGNCDEQKQKKYLNMIITSAEGAGELTKKLLLFTRKGHGLSSTIDMVEIVNETVNLLEHTINKNISISIVNNSTKTLILGDYSMLQNAIINLSINASHAMFSGGEIIITLGNITLGSEYCKTSPFEIETGDYLNIDIRDTGTGMSPEIQSHIFEPYFTTKEQGKGTGLGLATVYETIKTHNGAISVYSEEGTGTVFQLLFPITEIKLKDTKQKDILIGLGTILIIDDEELIRETTKEMLFSLGYKVLCAENGRIGVQIFSEKNMDIDLIILDMIMPVMGGREVFGKLREIDNNIPIIIASGFANENEIEELNKKKISGIINKPFRRVELAEVVAKVLVHTYDD